MGKSDLKTVIAPSRQARLSDLQIRNVIKGLIGRSLDVFLRKRGMTIGLIFFICTSMTSTVRAECVPYPDCSSIGYTETSCSGNFLRCPFDTTKMACISSQSGGANCRIGDIYYTDTTSNNAAKYCNEYTGGISGTSGKWYLLAAGEVYVYIFGYYNILKNTVSTLGWSNFIGAGLWSSSEKSESSAWYVLPEYDSVGYGSKDDSSRYVSCFLAL